MSDDLDLDAIEADLWLHAGGDDGNVRKLCAVVRTLRTQAAELGSIVCSGCGVDRSEHQTYCGEPSYDRQVSEDGEYKPDRCGEWVTRGEYDALAKVAELTTRLDHEHRRAEALVSRDVAADETIRVLEARALAAEARAEKAEREIAEVDMILKVVGADRDFRRRLLCSTRDRLATAEAALDDAIKSGHALASHAESCRVAAERERDEARAERDTRPDITREDARRVAGGREYTHGNGLSFDGDKAAWEAFDRVEAALRAHAEGGER